MLPVCGLPVTLTNNPLLHVALGDLTKMHIFGDTPSCIVRPHWNLPSSYYIHPELLKSIIFYLNSAFRKFVIINSDV